MSSSNVLSVAQDSPSSSDVAEGRHQVGHAWRLSREMTHFAAGVYLAPDRRTRKPHLIVSLP